MDVPAAAFFAVDFLAVDFLAVDFLAVDFFAVDFFAVDFLAVDFFAVRSSCSSSSTRRSKARDRRVAADSSWAETRPSRATDRSTSARTRLTSRSRLARPVASRSSVREPTWVRTGAGTTAPTPSPCATMAFAAWRARSRVTSVKPLASWM